jgi:hypothetical protein
LRQGLNGESYEESDDASEESFDSLNSDERKEVLKMMELEGVDVSMYSNLDTSEYKDQIDKWFSGGSQKNSNASEMKSSISKDIRDHIMK